MTITFDDLSIDIDDLTYTIDGEVWVPQPEDITYLRVVYDPEAASVRGTFVSSLSERGTYATSTALRGTSSTSIAKRGVAP